MKSLWGIAPFATFALAACSAPATLDNGSNKSTSHNEKTIFVIRHLQKEQGDDPSLTSEGAAAAERLAHLLADEDISAIYATRTRRAMETAAPLANMTDIAITAYDPQNPEALATPVAENEGAVLVVGHSNTVPDLIVRFGGNSAPQLTEEDYGTVFAIDSAGEVHEIKVD
ncbi:histidine phosphatase family protein [Aurantiacibacter marinus]|uniref:Phosphoglycerate mutase n=1 Tax=Aurantiacibacter marinus TaxID=874156 RepID=A0A0H0XPV2_9SPHN|nr:histidine phosphatase family protein [Aurantiacibacter marinus]KLI64349.1 hypothetical protein AAV99_01605 [Aurantiacibacter marinus]